MVSISPLGPPHILPRGVNNLPRGVNNLPGPLRVFQRNGNIRQVRCKCYSAVATIRQVRHKFSSMVSSPGCHHVGWSAGVNQSAQSAVHTQAQCKHITCSFAVSASPSDHLYLLKHNVSASCASSWCQEVRPDHLQVPSMVSSPPPGSRMSSNPVYLPHQVSMKLYIPSKMSPHLPGSLSVLKPSVSAPPGVNDPTGLQTPGQILEQHCDINNYIEFVTHSFQFIV